MPRYEYKLVAAPVKSTRHKGLKDADAFAATLQDVMNDMGALGWHYLRCETLPETVRSGLTSRTIVHRNLLVFQRALPATDRPRRADGPAPTDAADDRDGTDDRAALANLFVELDPPEPEPGPGRARG